MESSNGSCKCGVFMMIAKVLVIVGGINWGLVGFFDYNLVNALLGAWPIVEKVIYDVVGVASLLLLVGMFKQCSCSMPANK